MKKFEFNEAELHALNFVQTERKAQKQLAQTGKKGQFGDFSRGSIVLQGVDLIAHDDEGKMLQSVETKLKSHLKDDALANLLLSAGGQSCCGFITQLIQEHFFTKFNTDADMNAAFLSVTRVKNEPFITWKKSNSSQNFHGQLCIQFNDNGMKDEGRQTHSIIAKANITLGFKKNKPNEPNFKIHSVSFETEHEEAIHFNFNPKLVSDISQQEAHKMPILKDISLKKSDSGDQAPATSFKECFTTAPSFASALLFSGLNVVKTSLKPVGYVAGGLGLVALAGGLYSMLASQSESATDDKKPTARPS